MNFEKRSWNFPTSLTLARRVRGKARLAAHKAVAGLGSNQHFLELEKGDGQKMKYDMKIIEQRFNFLDQQITASQANNERLRAARESVSADLIKLESQLREWDSLPVGYRRDAQSDRDLERLKQRIEGLRAKKQELHQQYAKCSESAKWARELRRSCEAFLQKHNVPLPDSDPYTQSAQLISG